MYNNELTGEIPVSIGKLTELRNLDLSQNQLTGGLPSELGNMQNLVYSYLSNNQLTGTVPESLGRLTSLEYMNFGKNMLSGDLPQAVTSSSWWQKSGWVCIGQNSRADLTSIHLICICPILLQLIIREIQ